MRFFVPLLQSKNEGNAAPEQLEKSGSDACLTCHHRPRNIELLALMERERFQQGGKRYQKLVENIPETDSVNSYISDILLLGKTALEAWSNEVESGIR
jgi:hypothetical protein